MDIYPTDVTKTIGSNEHPNIVLVNFMRGILYQVGKKYYLKWDEYSPMEITEDSWNNARAAQLNEVFRIEYVT